MKSVYSLAIKSLLRDLKTYIFIAIMFLAEGFFLTYINFNNQYSAIEYSLEFIEIALMLVLPLITAEVFTADRESGFEKTLFAFGVPKASLYAGRTLASLTVFAVPYLLLIIAPFIFGVFGIVNFGATFSSVLAYFLVGISLVSVCLFISLTVKKRLHSYIISYVAMLVIYFFGIFASVVPMSRGFSLLLLTVIAVVIAVLIYLFTKSGIVSGGFFCIVEALLILFYFVTPKAFGRAFSVFLDLLSPCSSLNAVVYGPFDLAAIAHLILFTAVFVLLSLVQLHRRKYE